MRKFKTCRPRGLPICLFIVLAGALLLTAAFVPKAHADLIVYFNFEDSAVGDPFDPAADVIPANGGDNPGGGLQFSTLTYTGASDTRLALAIADVNRTAADIDIPANTGHAGLAMNLNNTGGNNGAFLQFNVNTLALGNLQFLSLSFACDNNGNGFHAAQLQYSTTGAPGTFTNVGSAMIITNGTNQLITSGTFSVVQSATGVFRLTFSGGASNGNNRETVIDNIQLNASLVPEPATVVGGLLGVLGVCWFQRRRLIRSVRLLRT